MTKKLILHFNFMKEQLERAPLTFTRLSELMKNEFGVSSQYVFQEVEELVALKKIDKIKHNNQLLLLWTKTQVKFDYELSTNIVQLDKQYIIFLTQPSKVRQMKLPIYVLDEFNKKIKGLTEKIELMLEIKAIKSGKTWYKVKQKE